MNRRWLPSSLSPSHQRARIDKARRRAAAPLDVTAFTGRGMIHLPSPVSSELDRLWSYRLGLSGKYGKYRVVPRSAIVAYDQLAATVQDDRGEVALRAMIEHLWQRHGAPSTEVVDRFLAEAERHDRLVASGAVTDVAAQRQRLLDAWLRECAPRSAAGRLRDDVELAVCYLGRRTRQYWALARRKVGTSFSREVGSTSP